MPLIFNKDLWLTGCFKIQILTTDGDPLDVTAAKPIFKINGFEHLSSYFDQYPLDQEADPFLFVRNDKLFLFFESKRFYEKGELKMTSTADLKSWSEPVTVLKEPFHLSYPWVFEDNDEIYMIPETQEDKCIRLYKADDDTLTSFSFVKKLIVDNEPTGIIHSFCDSSFAVKDGKYYSLPRSCVLMAAKSSRFTCSAFSCRAVLRANMWNTLAAPFACRTNMAAMAAA